MQHKATILRSDAHGLTLRPLEAEDAAWICTLANNYNVAKMVSRIPHPYTLEMAHEFLEIQAANRKTNASHVFAIVADEPVGVIGLDEDKQGAVELGYWLGEPYWGRGYATAAVDMMLAFAFDDRCYARLWAGHFLDNPASGRVLEKNGFEDVSCIDARECLARRETVSCRRLELSRTAWRARRQARLGT